MSDIDAAWAAHDDRVDALMAMTRERDELRAEVEKWKERAEAAWQEIQEMVTDA